MKRITTKRMVIETARNQIYLLPSIGVVYGKALGTRKLNRVNIAFAWFTFAATFTIWRKEGH